MLIKLSLCLPDVRWGKREDRNLTLSLNGVVSLHREGGREGRKRKRGREGSRQAELFKLALLKYNQRSTSLEMVHSQSAAGYVQKPRISS